jgi:hypothetical protein
MSTVFIVGAIIGAVLVTDIWMATTAPAPWSVLAWLSFGGVLLGLLCLLIGGMARNDD